MIILHFRKFKLILILLLCSSLSLQGCFGPDEIKNVAQTQGEENNANNNIDATDSSTNTAVSASRSHEGEIGNGLIFGAMVDYLRGDSSVAGSSDRNELASYKVTISGSESYPLVAQAKGGMEKTGGKPQSLTYYAPVVSPDNHVIDINAYTTLIYYLAIDLPGGLSVANVNTGKSLVMNNLGLGLDVIENYDPLSTSVNDSNAANMVLANFLLTEIFTRAAADYQSIKGSLTPNEFAQRLAVTMIDGGKSDPYLAALWKLTSAEVILQLFAGTLTVDGSDIGTRVDSAIDSILPQSNVRFTDIIVGQSLLQSASGGVTVAANLQNSDDLHLLASELAALPTGGPLTQYASDTYTVAANGVASLGAAINSYTPEQSLAAISPAPAGGNNPPPQGGQTPPPTGAPMKAYDDTITVNAGASLAIDVLANDSISTQDPVTVAVLQIPQNGTATAGADNKIVYSNSATAPTSDSFIYQISDQQGNSATASVKITILCPNCAPLGRKIKLSWTNSENFIDGYIVRWGKSAASISQTAGDTSSTYLNLDLGSDLLLAAGDTACFQVSSYNYFGESPPSAAVCMVY